MCCWVGWEYYLFYCFVAAHSNFAEVYPSKEIAYRSEGQDCFSDSVSLNLSGCRTLLLGWIVVKDLIADFDCFLLHFRLVERLEERLLALPQRDSVELGLPSVPHTFA